MPNQLFKPNEQAQLLNADTFSADIMTVIHREKWLLMWVAQQFNGLDLPFSQGLEVLYQLAKIDGSLGWFVTLCAGANYFSKNLAPKTATEIFATPNVCLGGSGMVGGTAEPLNENEFILNGQWKYATGSPHLTHFTLNAQVQDEIVSFVLPKEKVKIIPDWTSMGMRATNTFSFEVTNVAVDKQYSFQYDKFFTQDNTAAIPFVAFADLTLLVNYIGMAQSFAEKVGKPTMQHYVENARIETLTIAKEIEQQVATTELSDPKIIQAIHSFGEATVEKLCEYFAQTYPKAGIIASRTTSPINQVFRDFFTATQHANFRKK
jgi:alkylation response protein AidB-like acyl-CoA dehydrogenase